MRKPQSSASPTGSRRLVLGLLLCAVSTRVCGASIIEPDEALVRRQTTKKSRRLLQQQQQRVQNQPFTSPEQQQQHRQLNVGAHNPLDIVTEAFRAAAPPKGTGPLPVATDCIKHLKGSKKGGKGKGGSLASKRPPLCGESGSGAVPPLPPPPPVDTIAPVAPDDDKVSGGSSANDDVAGRQDDTVVSNDDATVAPPPTAGRLEPTYAPIMQYPTASGSTPAPVYAPSVYPPVASSPASSPVSAPFASSPVSAPFASPVSSPVASPVSSPFATPVSSPVASPTSASPVSLPIIAPTLAPTRRPSLAPITTCEAIADDSFVSNAPTETTFTIQLGLAISSTASVEQVLDELRNSLQTNVAPLLTNCSNGRSDASVSGRTQDDDFYSNQNGTSDGSNNATRFLLIATPTISNDGGVRGRQRRFLQDTSTSTSTTTPATIVNVVFGSLEVDQFNDCSEFGIASDGQTICVTTASQVTAYSGNDGSIEGFPDSLETAIMSSDLGVEGNDVVSSLVTTSPNGTPSVPEGGGGGNNGGGGGSVTGDDKTDDLTNDDDGTSGIEGPSNMDPGSGGISAGSAVGMTAGLLAIILLSGFAVRRNRRRYREENSLLKAANTDDDEDDDMLQSGASASASAYSRSTPTHNSKRIAHVLGEDDSIVTSDHTYSDGIEVQPVYAASRVNRNLLDNTFDSQDDYMTDEDINVDDNVEMDYHTQHADHHWCSSPHCQSCEQKRQKGVTFIPTMPQRGSHIPRNARRNYDSNDTVDL